MSFDVLTIKSNDKSILSTNFIFEFLETKSLITKQLITVEQVWVDFFSKTIQETGLETGSTISVAISLKTEKSDTSLLANVRMMKSKSLDTENKVIHWKWNGTKNVYFHINTECYSYSNAKYAYHRYHQQNYSSVTKKENVLTTRDKTKQVNSSSKSSVSRKKQKVSHLLFL